jgi:mitochondrial fission protein ELM1
MSKLKGLLLTEGLHGMISQVEGLAKALDLEYFHEKIELNNFWKLIPPSLTPVKKYVFKNNIEKEFDIIISCGRKSVVPSIYLKKNSNKEIINIHIQNPKVSFNNFNYIIAPEHDGISGKNVISSKGALHYLTIEEIEKSKDYLQNKTNTKKDILTLILGGPTKYYDYSTQNIKSIFTKINNLTEKNNLHLIVIPSNRTPMETVLLAKSELMKDRTIIETVDKKAYLSALCLAKYIVVTCDSSSMISEAALTGKPVYVAMIETKRNDKRFKEFRKLFENMNILRKLDDKLETWSYEKLDEANRVSKLIKLK